MFAIYAAASCILITIRSAPSAEADSTPLDDGLSIPDEIVRRENRVKSLEKARRVIEEQHKAGQQAEYEKQKGKRDKQHREGKKPKGPEPKPPEATAPDNKKQYSFTNYESRYWKAF